MKIRLKNLCLALVALMCLVLLSSCGSAPQPKQSVASMEDIGIKAQPKTAYILGDPFDVSAGVLNLFYDDGTIKELPFTAEGVTISAPDMETVGTKTVNVDYDGFKVSYMITIETQKYAVSFDLNYAGASAPAVQMVEAGAYAARPSDPVREGYRFGGWYADANATTAFDFSAAAITGDVTVYAAWTAVYSVTFDLNDGASQATTVVVDAGTPIQEMMAPAAAREGYEFAKWHTDPEADTPYDFTQAVSADVVLYAHWAEIQAGATMVAVTFDYNGAGTLTARTESIVSGNSVEKPQDPDVEGRTFTGWFTAPEGGEAFDFTAAVTEDITLYAGWDVEYYLVRFHYIIDGKDTVMRTREIDPGAKAAAGAVPVVAGYKFTNTWYTDAEYTQVYDFKKPVHQDYNLYIKPMKEYRFEAEHTFIDENKAGVGSSDNFSGLKLIFKDNGTAEASNGFWVSGLYYNTAFVEFVIHSDAAINDAMLQLRLSSEWADMYIAPEDTNFNGKDYYSFAISSAPAQVDEAGNVLKDEKGYAISVADQARTFDYTPIAITGAITFSQSMVDKRPFSDYLMTTEFALQEGWNVVRLTVNNSHAPYDGTMEATAPMIDCMSIFTDATLTWIPVEENVADPSRVNNG